MNSFSDSRASNLEAAKDGLLVGNRDCMDLKEAIMITRKVIILNGLNWDELVDKSVYFKLVN